MLSASLRESPLPVEPCFAADRSLVCHLKRARMVVHRSALVRLSPLLRAVCEQALRRTKADAIIPMTSGSGPMGWFFVGPGSLKELSRDDLKELNMIGGCLAEFLERNEEQAAKLRDAETSHARLDHLEASAMILDATMTVSWMNSQVREIFGDRFAKSISLEELDPGFADVLKDAVSEHQKARRLWSASNHEGDYAVTVIPVQVPAGALVLLQSLHERAALQALEGQRLHSNLCTKIRDALVAIRAFIQLLPDRGGRTWILREIHAHRLRLGGSAREFNVDLGAPSV
ncbi:MAG: hypothetical protein ACI8T1_000260 [Verrucomicrobiales bacterium]